MGFRFSRSLCLLLAQSSMIFTSGCGGKKSSSSSPATTSTSSDASSSGSSGSTSTTTQEKSTTVTGVSGTLALSALDSTSLTDSITITCKDALDGTVYAQGVTVDDSGNFDCGSKIPKCYGTDCSNVNPVQIEIINEKTSSTICVATAGDQGIVCDTAGCFGAAQAALKDDTKACLTKVNMVAAANVFQQALNKAFKMGQIPLDTYDLSQCMALSNAEKLAALEKLTQGTLAEVLINSLDAQLQKEIHKCDSSKGTAFSFRSTLRDFLTMGFAILQSGPEYTADLSTKDSIADKLKTIEDEIKLIKLAVANGQDPASLITENKIDKDTLLYQFTSKCLYSDTKESMGIERQVNDAKTDYKDCDATATFKDRGTLTLAGTAISTKLSYPDINDPDGSHGDQGDKDIPFEYLALKNILGTEGLSYSLDDIYDIFFANAQGLKFRLRSETQSGNDRHTYVIDDKGTATEIQSESDMADDKYKPSVDQVFGFLTSTTKNFDFDKLIKIKVHRPWNPTGQQFFYVNGKKVSGKDVPITCDILDADGKPAGMRIETGITVTCTATDTTADMKRYFISGFSNQNFIRLINKNNGQDVQTGNGAPILFQDLNQDPGESMPTCTAANQVSIFPFKSTQDQWMNGRTVKTICFDFSTIKNAAEYFTPYNAQVTIGNNSMSTFVLAGQTADGSTEPVCIGSSAITKTDVVGCMNDTTGAFSVCADTSNCSCNWQNHESMRTFQSITQPADTSVALMSCDSDSAGYYLSPYWEPGTKSSVAALKAVLIDKSTGQWLQQVNTSFDPSVVDSLITTAFTECKTSHWCWRKGDISSMSAATDIPADQSWMRQDIVRFYCGQHSDDATLQTSCAKLDQSVPVTISFSKFSNGSNAASTNIYKIYSNNSYFSFMKQPNPNYNKVFDYQTFTFKYDNYDPFCDDVDADGACTVDKDVYMSDIWQFDPAYNLYSPVAVTGYTLDSNHDLFPATPTSWDQNTWQTYVDPVFKKIGGPSAMSCSNDRTITLDWTNMHFSQNDLWTTEKSEICKATGSYFVVRNLRPNKNTYLINQPERLQALVRLAFGTLNKRSISSSEKRFDFVQAMSVFMLSMNLPPLVISDKGEYEPFYPTIDGKLVTNSWAGYGPTNYQGSLVSLIDLFVTKGTK